MDNCTQCDIDLHTAGLVGTSTVRIIAGKYGRRRLDAPKDQHTRPTSDRAREALFSILGDVEGWAVLDLFAGSGAVGLEALSRGAAALTIVEHDRAALAAIRSNLAALSVDADVQRGKVPAALQRLRGPFDLIFADPPYRDVGALIPHVLEASSTLLAENGVVVVEHDAKAPAPTPPRAMQLEQTRRYGAAALSFYRSSAEKGPNAVKYTHITPLAARLENVTPSATLALTQKARDLKAEGHDVVSLTAGEPDLPPAPHILEAAKKAIDDRQTRYTNVAGIEPLRAAIQQVYLRDDELKYELNEIVVSSGAKQAVFNSMQVLLDPGDEVIIPAPFWLSYRDIVHLAGGTPVIIDTAEDGYLLTPGKLSDAITDKTKALILNSPSNPTGAAYSGDQLKALAEVITKNERMVVIADEIYRRFHYAGGSAPTLLGVAPELQCRVLVMDGCSKTYAMTGFRIGWTAGPRNIISAMSKIQGQSTSNPATPSQYAALAAVTGDQTWVQDMVGTFETRKNFVVGRLNALPGVSCFDPAGAFYAFPDVSGLVGRKLPDGLEITDSVAFCAFLLHEHHVVAVPGKPFGAPNCLRLSFATDMDTLTKGLDRMDAAIRQLS